MKRSLNKFYKSNVKKTNKEYLVIDTETADLTFDNKLKVDTFRVKQTFIGKKLVSTQTKKVNIDSLNNS